MHTAAPALPAQLTKGVGIKELLGKAACARTIVLSADQPQHSHSGRTKAHSLQYLNGGKNCNNRASYTSLSSVCPSLTICTGEAAQDCCDALTSSYLMAFERLHLHDLSNSFWTIYTFGNNIQ